MVQPVKFVLGGTRLASGSFDHTIKLWDFSEPPPNDVLHVSGNGSPIAFTADGRLLATVSSNASEVLLWNAASGTLQTSLPHTDPAQILWSKVVDLAISREGVLAVGRLFEVSLGGTNSQRHRIELWDVQHRTVTNSFAGQAPICFSPTGHLFACQGTNGGTIQFRDMKTGRVWMSQGSYVVSPSKTEFAFSPEGRWLATCGDEFVLWDSTTGRRETLAFLTSDPREPIKTMAFTPDGHWLIASGANAEIYVWDMTTRRREGRRFPSAMAGVQCLAISPDGKTLATGSQVGAIKLWRLEPPDYHSGTRWEVRELLTLSEHRSGISALRFSRSPDGDILASSDTAGVVRLWRADSAGGPQSSDRETRP
jgi:WD40 repeat protein